MNNKKNFLKRQIKSESVTNYEVDPYNNFHLLCDEENLFNAFIESSKQVNWKESIQKYDLNLVGNIMRLSKQLREGSYELKGYYEFNINERGKKRHIKAVHIKDRVVIRCLCDKILIPILRKYIQYDNSASVKGRGISFARDRVDVHLRSYYNEYKTNKGYVLQLDFSKFFDNIRHDLLFESIKDKIKDERTLKVIEQIINSFAIDVSYLSDDEYRRCIDIIFSSNDYEKIPNELKTGEKFLHKSMGIGSQISQVAGIYYPTYLDQLCKVVLGIKRYSRYNDDIYIIENSKEKLLEYLNIIEDAIKNLGLYVNRKKTQINKLSKGFIYLKIKYILRESGKISKYMHKSTFNRHLNRIKKYNKIFRDNKHNITFEDILLSHKCVMGNMKCYDSYYKCKRLDLLFYDLFKNEIIEYNKIKNMEKEDIKDMFKRMFENITINGSTNNIKNGYLTGIIDYYDIKLLDYSDLDEYEE